VEETANFLITDSRCMESQEDKMNLKKFAVHCGCILC